MVSENIANTKLLNDITEVVLNHFKSENKFNKTYFMQMGNGHVAEVNTPDAFAFQQFNNDYIEIVGFSNADKNVIEFERGASLINYKNYITNKILKDVLTWGIEYLKINSSFKLSAL